MISANPSAGQALLAACGTMNVINLPFRDDRRREFAGQLRRIGLGFDHPEVRLFPAVRPEEAGPFPSVGARGCFLSHLGVLRAALETGADRVLICEDDLDFARDFNGRAPGLLAALQQQDWDIFYGFQPDALQPPGPGLFEIAPDQPVLLAHFVAFRRPAIEALVPYLEAILQRPPGDPAGGPMHVDGAYGWFRAACPQMRTLAVAPSLGHQRSSQTNIAEGGIRDRLPVVRTVLRHARRLRNRLRG